MSWYGTCFAEQPTNKDVQKKFEDQASMHSSNNGQRMTTTTQDSQNVEKVDQINAKLGFDKDYTWFKVGQGFFTTLWLGISRTNVTLLNKDKSEEMGNYARSNFTILSSTSNR